MISPAKNAISNVKERAHDADRIFWIAPQIVTALEDSKLYMLQPENYILHEDYLFIEGSLHLGTLYLTYVPVAPSKQAALVFRLCSRN